MDKKIRNVFRFFIRSPLENLNRPRTQRKLSENGKRVFIQTYIPCHPPLQQRNVMEDNYYYTC